MINKVILVGRVGKDVEVKNFDNGSKVANFTLATNYSYKKQDGEKVEKTEWHNIVINGKLSDVAEKYVKKGDILYIEGRIEQRSYDDKDGVKRYVTNVILEELKMLGGKSSGTATTDTATSIENPIINKDDLPF